MKISVVIPTWQRPDYLALALKGLVEQQRPVDEILIGVRKDDQQTHDYLQSIQKDLLPIHIAHPERPGTVASMQAALDLSTGDVVCLLDDDAEPTPDWLAKIERYFQSDEHLGCIGGRDLLMYLDPVSRDQNLQKLVGISLWYGGSVGNHHCGTGGYREVEFIKGCNCAFRGDLLRKVGFESRLRGTGTQHEWEMALCHDVKNAGYRIAYDSELQVKHHVAPRFGTDQNHRGGFNAEGIKELAYNQAFVIQSRLRGWKRFSQKAYCRIVGSAIIPGFVQYIRLLFFKREPMATERWKAVRKGWSEAIRDTKAIKP